MKQWIIYICSYIFIIIAIAFSFFLIADFISQSITDIGMLEHSGKNWNRVLLYLITFILPFWIAYSILSGIRFYPPIKGSSKIPSNQIHEFHVEVKKYIDSLSDINNSSINQVLDDLERLSDLFENLSEAWEQQEGKFKLLQKQILAESLQLKRSRKDNEFLKKLNGSQLEILKLAFRTEIEEQGTKSFWVGVVFSFWIGIITSIFAAYIYHYLI